MYFEFRQITLPYIVEKCEKNYKNIQIYSVLILKFNCVYGIIFLIVGLCGFLCFRNKKHAVIRDLNVESISLFHIRTIGYQDF